MHDPQVPVTLLDLTQASHQKILIDLLHNRPPDYIHLGMPCGTASRARERPVARNKINQGAPQPPPLRSADHPLGLPHINPESTSGVRLAKANILYRFVVDILLIAMKYNSVISLENPYRSWFWAAILAYVQAQNNADLTKFWDSLTEIFFHNCCHGGQRKKGTRWKSTPGVFTQLTANCQNDHDHLPYQVQSQNGTWTFDTSSEAAYPQLLAARVAAAVKKFFVKQKPFFFSPPKSQRENVSRSTPPAQKRNQLIPEFSETRWLPSTASLTDQQKVIPSSFRGECQEGNPQEKSEGDVLVGTWYTPTQFVKEARKANRPMDENALEQITMDAIEYVACNSPELVSIERKKNLLKARILAKQLEGQEKELHDNFPDSIEKVVKGKKILL